MAFSYSTPIAAALFTVIKISFLLNTLIRIFMLGGARVWQSVLLFHKSLLSVFRHPRSHALSDSFHLTVVGDILWCQIQNVYVLTFINRPNMAAQNGSFSKPNN